MIKIEHYFNLNLALKYCLNLNRYNSEVYYRFIDFPNSDDTLNYYASEINVLKRLIKRENEKNANFGKDSIKIKKIIE